MDIQDVMNTDLLTVSSQATLREADTGHYAKYLQNSKIAERRRTS
jgi:hypothetical protein